MSPARDCHYYDEKIKLFKNLQSEEKPFGKVLNELKEAVCNKPGKGFCCPKPEKQDNSCVSTSECAVNKAMLETYLDLREKNPDNANLILEELKSRKCDEEKQHLWCPAPPRVSTDTESPSYLPRPGGAQCGTNPERRIGFIIGGEDTEAGEFPYLGLLGNTQKGRTRWFCAGTLINKYYVLTAGHCVNTGDLARINKVRLGEWNVGRGGGDLPRDQDFQIGPHDVIKHPGYKVGRTEVVNDIALVRLPRAAKLNRGVRLACLPFLPSEWPLPLREGGLGGHNGTVVGWGYTDNDPWKQTGEGDQENRVASAKQQKLVLPLLKPGDCGRFTVGASVLCAGGVRGEDTCKGDSGGPLLYRENDQRPWYLVGLVSYGTRVCGRGEPAVYTRITSFIPWIVENIK